MTEIVIEKPSYLYLLLVLPALIGLFVYGYYWQRIKRKQFADSALLNRLLPYQAHYKGVIKAMLVLIAIAGMIFALINPLKGNRAEIVKRKGFDIVFAIDVSKSMLAEDVPPNRLERSRQIANQVINRLGTDRVGIIGYAGSAYPVLPVTTDFGMAKMYLQGMNTNMVSSQGTAIADAIKLSVSYFDNPNTSKVLVLISDGEDHGKDAEKAAEEAKDNGIKIISVGVGTTDGGPIPMKVDGITREYKKDNEGKTVVTKLYPDHLAALSGITGGQYLEEGTTAQIAGEIMKITSQLEKAEFEARTIAGFDSQYQWPAALALLLLLLDIFIFSITGNKHALTFFKRNKQ